LIWYSPVLVLNFQISLFNIITDDFKCCQIAKGLIYVINPDIKEYNKNNPIIIYLIKGYPCNFSKDLKYSILLDLITASVAIITEIINKVA